VISINNLNKENGFTLLEFIVVIIILGILSVGIVSLMNRQAETFSRVFTNSDLLSNGRKAIDLLRRDLHSVSPDSISTMTSSSLSFKNSDGNTISYTLSSSTLSRNGVTQAEYIQNNPFSYLDASQNTAATIADLVFIKVDLQMGKSTETVQLEELIFLRN
jgi:prepilin-type N-terminal cleavage/methylation domain-containing protein